MFIIFFKKGDFCSRLIGTSSDIRIIRETFSSKRANKKTKSRIFFASNASFFHNFPRGEEIINVSSSEKYTVLAARGAIVQITSLLLGYGKAYN